MTTQIDIRPLQQQSEFDACEEIQIAAWQMGERDVVPAHLLKVIAARGAVALGAFTPDERLVGFVYSLLSRTHDERRQQLNGSSYYQHSEMMGVHPDFQNQSIGTRLKWAQREAALMGGYRLITWTFDPMLGPNANLNISHLGVTCRHYIRDAYGELDGIYEGLNTDRFEVEWWLKSPRVQLLANRPEPSDSLDALLADGATIVNPTSRTAGGLPEPSDIDLPPVGLLLIEIPLDFNAIRTADLALAGQWREHGRSVFEAAFDAGYIVQRFARTEDRNFYILWQDYEN